MGAPAAFFADYPTEIPKLIPEQIRVLHARSVEIAVSWQAIPMPAIGFPKESHDLGGLDPLGEGLQSGWSLITYSLSYGPAGVNVAGFQARACFGGDSI